MFGADKVREYIEAGKMVKEGEEPEEKKKPEEKPKKKKLFPGVKTMGTNISGFTKNLLKDF